MNVKREDIRSKRTQQRLKKALCELMYSRPVNKITVKELTDKAHVYRCTFYLYYDNIYDMIDSIQIGLVENYKKGIQDILSKGLREKELLLEISRFSFQNTADNLPFSKLFYLQEDPKYIERFANIILAEVNLQYELSTFENEEFFRFCTYGALSLISNWIINDMPKSIDEMANLVCNIVYGSLSS